jgi:phosphoglycerol transferase MdoB-like AlkP superfamily enzyme
MNNTEITTTPSHAYRLSFLVVGSAFILSTKIFYLNMLRVDLTFESWSQVLEECLLSFVFLLVHDLLSRQATGRWRRVVLLCLMLSFGAIFLINTLLFSGLWFLGSLPRLVQLRGLTGEIADAAILPLLWGHRFEAFAAIVTGCLLFWVFSRLFRRTSWRFSRSLLQSLTLCSLLLYLGESARIYFSSGKLPEARNLVSLALKSAATHRPSTPRQRNEADEYFQQMKHKRESAVGIKAAYAPFYQKLTHKNIILVVMESVRAADIAIYGGNLHLPHLESKLSNAVVLERVYAQDPRSTKAYTALDLGLYSMLAWESVSNNKTTGLATQSFARQLRKLGYYTMSIVNGDGLYDQHRAFQVHRGYDEVLYRQQLNPGSNNSDDDLILKRVESELENIHQPFYFLLWPLMTHHPYGRSYWVQKEKWLKNHPEGIRHGAPGDYGLYLASLLELDGFLKKLWNIIEKKNLLEDTVIILSGDHGEAFGEYHPNNFFHGNNVYEESSHVPALLFHPSIPGTLRDNTLMMTKDLPALMHDLVQPGSIYFGQGRSPLYEYAESIPVFLYNSFSQTMAIISEAGKFRKGSQAMAPTYYSELNPASGLVQDETKKWENEPTGKKLRGKLQQWEAAMRIRTRDLLFPDDESQRVSISDNFRIYCDEGHGFSESTRRMTPIQNTKASLIVPIGLKCQALRFAPLEKWKGHLLNRIRVRFDDMKIVLDRHSKRWIGPRSLQRHHHVHMHHDFEFDIVGPAPSVDYQVSTEPIEIHRIQLDVEYVFLQ